MRALTRAGLINAGLTIILLAAAAAAGPAQARARPAARVTPAVVLVNQPAARVCTGHTFRVGVWYQRSGGSRAYRVAVIDVDERARAALGDVLGVAVSEATARRRELDTRHQASVDTM